MTNNPTNAERVDVEICMDCDAREYPMWAADNDLWNSVMPDDGGKLCLPCFVVRAQAAGIEFFRLSDGDVPEVEDGADLKSAGECRGGSTPPIPTNAELAERCARALGWAQHSEPHEDGTTYWQRPDREPMYAERVGPRATYDPATDIGQAVELFFALRHKHPLKHYDLRICIGAHGDDVEVQFTEYEDCDCPHGGYDKVMREADASNRQIARALVLAVLAAVEAKEE